MDKDESALLINSSGGDAAFARLLGIAGEKGAKQRINNWKRRGIPASVVLEHQLVIEALRRKAKVAA